MCLNVLLSAMKWPLIHCYIICTVYVVHYSFWSTLHWSVHSVQLSALLFHKVFEASDFKALFFENSAQN